MIEDRPVHVVLNGLEATAVPVTDAEWADMRVRDAAAVVAEQKAAAQRAADTALIGARAQDDPAFAALARALGYPLKEGGIDAPAPSAPAGTADGEAGQGSGPAQPE